MRILLTNDDGIDADGINVLYDRLKGEHNCVMIAPDGERSAASHSLSIHSDLSYSSREKGYAVSGTPADCVKLGVLHLLSEKPDLVISGINNGPNLGSDIMYSGTVSAALEAAYLGVRGIAVSMSKHNPDKVYFERAAELVAQKLDKLFALPLRSDTVLSINYPVRAPYIGLRFTKAGVNLYNDTFVAGDSEGTVRLKGVPIAHEHNNEDCDVELIKKGYATITPLTLDRNDYASLDKLKKLTDF